MASEPTTQPELVVLPEQSAQDTDAQTPETKKDESSTNPLSGDVEKYIQETLELWRIPGMSVAVIDGDNIYTEGYGHAILPDVSATADTIWYAGSTTKAQVAALLAHLIRSGDYKQQLPRGWDTPISSILRDDFVLQDEWATAHITLNDAVGHRSGMGRHDLAMRGSEDGKHLDTKDAVRNMRNLPMVAEPRVKYIYCNFMYIAVGCVVEKLTNMSLGDALNKYIWSPLGMTSTYFSTDDAIKAPQDFASAYAWDEKAEIYKNIAHTPLHDVGAAGAIISNVKDYAKWVKCLIEQGAPFSEDTHFDIKKPRTFMAADQYDNLSVMTYSLGWERKIMGGETVFQHSGGLTTGGAEVFWLPEVKFGVVAFANTAQSSNFAALDVAHRLINDKLNIPAENRFDVRAESIQMRDGMPSKEESLKALLPDLPATPKPSSFTTSELAGRYHNDGWGPIVLTEEQDAEDAGKTVLVGPRQEATFKHTLTLSHASGDYWLVKVALDGNTRYITAYVTAKFVAGVDGKPAAIELNTAQVYEAGDGIITFKRSDKAE